MIALDETTDFGSHEWSGMTDFLQSERFSQAQSLKESLEPQLKDPVSVKSLEIAIQAESIEDAKHFKEILLALRGKGVKISTDFSIRLEFPETMNRDKTLSIIEKLPKLKNGSLKVKIGYCKESLKTT